MKKFILLMVLLFSSSIFATGFNLDKDHPKFETVEKNLIVNTESGNLGVLTSSIYMLGEIKSEKAVIPLVKILRNSESEELKILSALSLTKIGTPYSRYIVKRVGELSEDKKTSEMLIKFYNATK